MNEWMNENLHHHILMGSLFARVAFLFPWRRLVQVFIPVLTSPADLIKGENLFLSMVHLASHRVSSLMIFMLKMSYQLPLMSTNRKLLSLELIKLRKNVFIVQVQSRWLFSHHNVFIMLCLIFNCHSSTTASSSSSSVCCHALMCPPWSSSYVQPKLATTCVSTNVCVHEEDTEQKHHVNPSKMDSVCFSS